MKNMKKLIVVLLALSMVLAMVPMTFVSADTWDGTTIAKDFESGSGTEADPFIIKTAAQLAYLAQRVNGIPNEKDPDKMEGKYFKLDADIDLGGKQWTPIGHSSSQPFCGVFDGNNKTISGLFIDHADVTVVEVAGLFGATKGATLKNIVLTGTKVHGGKYVGGLVAYPRYGSQIINVSVSINEVIGEVTGGVVGRSEKLGEDNAKTRNLILLCSFEGSVYGTSESYGVSRTAYVGGVVGVAGHADIRYCVNKGDVTADSGPSSRVTPVGGIVGCAGASEGNTFVDHCINTGNIQIKGDNSIVGGIVGRANHVQGGSVTYCINLGQVSAVGSTTKIGTLVGLYIKGSAAMGYVHNISVKVGDFPLEGHNADEEVSELALIDDEFYLDITNPTAPYPRSCIFVEKTAVAGTGVVGKLAGYTSEFWTDGTAYPEAKKDAIIAKVLADRNWYETAPLPEVETPTTDAPTTDAPTTNKPVESSDPEESGEVTSTPAATKNPESQANAEEKGCGGMIAGGLAVIAIVSLGGVMLKKRD